MQSSVKMPLNLVHEILLLCLHVYMQLIGYVKLFYMHVVHRGKASQKYATALCGLLQV